MTQVRARLGILGCRSFVLSFDTHSTAVEVGLTIVHLGNDNT